MKYEELDYSDRIVAFIDILGFRNHINESLDSEGKTKREKFEQILASVDVFNSTWRNEPNYVLSKQVTLFSDSAIISFRADEPDEVFFTLLQLLHINMELLRNKVLCRGAISAGKCFHDDTRVFGPSINRAYDMEQKGAIYPRIVVDPEVIQLGSKAPGSLYDPESEREEIKSLLRMDFDGQFFLDYFTGAFSEVNDHYSEYLYIENLRAIISENLEKYKTNPPILAKYQWMQMKYNEMIELIHTSSGMDNLRKDDQDTYTMFKSCKRIEL